MVALMTRDHDLLVGIAHSAQIVEQLLAVVDQEKFLADAVLPRAVEEQLVAVVRASNRVSPAAKAKTAGVPWQGLRDLYDREEDRLLLNNPAMIWEFATKILPKIRYRVDAALKEPARPDAVRARPGA
jgi:uncharacterized protein with HEPN domain